MNNYQPLSQQETKEFFDALESLDEKQNLTLYNFSAQLLNGSGYTSGIDLLHEVIDRVLKGSRKWRRDIPFGAFLHEEWMEASANTDDEANNEFACTPEELLMKRQEEQQCRDVINGAKARLAHDKEALAIFSGLAEQMTPAEIRKAYKISESGYKAARARIAMEIRAHITGPLH
jgi:hypothetical protein